jgi:hypothetical protein
LVFQPYCKETDEGAGENDDDDDDDDDNDDDDDKTGLTRSCMHRRPNRY